MFLKSRLGGENRPSGRWAKGFALSPTFCPDYRMRGGAFAWSSGGGPGRREEGETLRILDEGRGWRTKEQPLAARTWPILPRSTRDVISLLLALGRGRSDDAAAAAGSIDRLVRGGGPCHSLNSCVSSVCFLVVLVAGGSSLNSVVCL